MKTEQLFGLSNSIRTEGAGVVVDDSDPYPGVTVYDSFTDANSTALTSHTPEKIPTGQSWTAITGTMDIQSNEASWASGLPSVQVIDTGLTDCTISAICTTSGGGANDQNGISFRVVDVNNRWFAYLNNQGNTVGLIEVVSGTPSGPDAGDASAAILLANNTQYTLEVILSGNDITVKVDGTTYLNATDSSHATATKHGLYAGIAGHKFDEFQVV